MQQRNKLEQAKKKIKQRIKWIMGTTMGWARVAAWKTTPSATEVAAKTDVKSRFIRFTVSWQLTYFIYISWMNHYAVW